MSKKIKIVTVLSSKINDANIYKAQDKLQQEGKKFNYDIKVEIQEDHKIKNKLSTKAIKKASYVVIAASYIINKNRFIGKKVLFTSIAKIISDPQLLFINGPDSPILNNWN